MTTISLAVIGAGNRGNIYSDFATLFPEKFKVVAVAEPNQERREEFVKKHKIDRNKVFESYETLLEKEKISDAVIVTTQDHDHYQPVIKALDKGYHVLVEKPMSPNLNECYEMVLKAKEKNRLLLLGYVLRYTPFFQKLKQLLANGVIGTPRHISIDMNVAYWHQAHSFVRGNWRNSKASSPMILAKSCHDFDIIQYLLDSTCRKISSFGDLLHFSKENAPIGSSERCIDCLVEDDCPYSAKKIYLQENTDWPVNTISTDLSFEGRRKALEQGPYGRCVYRCDNDVVDHQVVTMEFANNATATLTMSGFTEKLERHVKVLGTHGEIYGELKSNKLVVKRFAKGEEIYEVTPSTFGMHAGGDFGLMEQFWTSLTAKEMRNAEDTILSHLYAHIAEASRLRGETIVATDFLSQINGGNRVSKLTSLSR
ncbi:gfo/Idh/MocA family oxidoreductase [Anaerobacillus alkaliphilus]|uniref:Gfo/Idh/MocA family oxidoreductase n=1 Tax=Anaerobacillus alkaliphilus TaxID=1548597 RepID=A0A4Q0VSP6_9BACI|nr:Gfo/Idh/MocA family oxidoreductase [Anaerobacillus alkaliphilus]RXJ00690.1 gfo/Idh/MocA family oxidoreductase [Anaerobacillus alkaliphilus]